MITSPSRALLLLFALTACHAPVGSVGEPRDGTSRSMSPAPDAKAIRADIAVLAGDAFEGRGTGTSGNDSAAAFLARRYRALKLQPLAIDSTGASCDARPGTACPPAFLQKFTARPIAGAHSGPARSLPTQNVVAMLPGSDPVLTGEFVVIGAHVDHLGRDGEFAQDPEAKDAIRNGADDNASGTAALLELARLFSMVPTRRSLVFAHFSGEELGLLGSAHFVGSPPFPLARAQAMVNFDMVGRLRDNRVIVYGTATATEMRGIVDSANANVGLRVFAQGDGTGPSDHASFYLKDMPVLHFFTDLHDDYHRATDDIEKINAEGEARVVELAARIIRDLADRPSRLTFVRSAAAPVGTSSREGSNTYLGSVPDMAAGDVPGLRLTGIRPGSPADSGGLKAGDIIVEFDGKPVTDLYTYTDALYARQPGDMVHIVVLRGGDRITLNVTLGRRGG
jgi:hypothetical protein